MRVLVDTSVWVDFLNGHPSPQRQALANLFLSDHEVCTCGVVVAEVFQGLRKEEGRERLATLFRDLAYLEPAGIDLYFRAADLYRALRRRGKTIRSTINCLIAVLADEHGCSLLARDRDMDALLASGLLAVSRWPVAATAS
ncbi:MAG TPA: PIN domain-containing protein [Thermoanaerobaculia bacterium]